MTDKDNFKEVCDLTTRVLGLRKGTHRYSGRMQDITLCRLVAANIGRQEMKIKHTIIAKELNRHRSSIYYYEKEHEDKLVGWGKYRKAYLKVLKAYENLSDDKDFFVSDSQLEQHLKRYDLSDCDRHDMKIVITSGKAKTEIKSSVFKFSDKVKIIKLALNGYDFKTNIDIIR